MVMAGRTHAEGTSPEVVLARLKSGNARALRSPGGDAAPARAAAPVAAVLSCAESLAPAEQVFGAAPGELFVVRTLGHVVDHATLASLEFAVERLHVPLVVVLGHEFCGAVKAASEAVPGQSLGPHYDYWLKAMRPAVGRAGGSGSDERLRAAVLENVEESINTLLQESAVLRHLSQDKRVRIVGAFHEASTGRVLFSQMVDVPHLTGTVAERH